MKFRCSNCGKEIGVGKSKVNLTCQSCGCYDLKPNSPILAFPVLLDGSLGPESPLEEGEAFFGKHKEGTLWIIKVKEKGTVEIVPLVEGKLEDIVSGEVVKLPETVKPSIAGRVRKLRMKTNPT